MVGGAEDPVLVGWGDREKGFGDRQGGLGSRQWSRGEECVLSPGPYRTVRYAPSGTPLAQRVSEPWGGQGHESTMGNWMRACDTGAAPVHHTSLTLWRSRPWRGFPENLETPPAAGGSKQDRLAEPAPPPPQRVWVRGERTGNDFHLAGSPGTPPPRFCPEGGPQEGS